MKYNWKFFKNNVISYDYDNIIIEFKQDIINEIITDNVFIVREDNGLDYCPIIDWHYVSSPELLNLEDKYSLELSRDVLEEMEEMNTIF